MKVLLSNEGQREKEKEREKEGVRTTEVSLRIPILKHHFEQCSVCIRMANRRGQ